MTRILIVDDDADIRSLIGEILAEEDHDVVLAADGPDAIRCMRALAPDLVILDLSMPGMDGWETATRIRERSRVPVLFITARVADAERRRSVRIGAAGFMLKPFARRELVETVAEILDLSASSANDDCGQRVG
jgi:DNA-binding response OmpR family regulator